MENKSVEIKDNYSDFSFTVEKFITPNLNIKTIRCDFLEDLLKSVKLHKEDKNTDCFTDSQFYSLNYLAELKAKGLIK